MSGHTCKFPKCSNRDWGNSIKDPHRRRLHRFPKDEKRYLILNYAFVYKSY